MRLWSELADEFGAESLEYERKGAVVVARQVEALSALRELASDQARHGVDSEVIDGAGSA